MDPKKIKKHIFKKLNHYVYLLIDKNKNEIFYVGRGENERMFAHEFEALKKDLENPSEKESRIRQLNETDSIDYCVLRHGLSLEEAINVEAAVIDLMKSAYINQKFPITNKYRGFGLTKGIMSLEKVMRTYSGGYLDLNNLQYNILAINLNVTNESEDLYEAVRGDWRIDLRNAKKMDYIVAEDNGVIIGIYKVHHWENASKRYNKKDLTPEQWENACKRKFFTGAEVEDERIKSLYMYKIIDKKKGERIPIRYYMKKESKRNKQS